MELYHMNSVARQGKLTQFPNRVIWGDVLHLNSGYGGNHQWDKFVCDGEPELVDVQIIDPEPHTVKGHPHPLGSDTEARCVS